MRAFLNMRYSPPERVEKFKKGLMAVGYECKEGLTSNPRKNDLFVTWNRIGHADQIANTFQARGCQVIVAENGSWGKSFAEKSWLTLALRYHNSQGCFPIGGNERFDQLNVNLQPFRTQGETVILAQRGIGSQPTAMPRSWPDDARKRYKCRIRKHPGKNAKNVISLEDDLKDCGLVVTWGSGAAIAALTMGIPVVSEMKNWIGEQDNTVEGRLKMFRQMAWAQWTLDEIEKGDPFKWLLR